MSNLCINKKMKAVILEGSPLEVRKLLEKFVEENKPSHIEEIVQSESNGGTGVHLTLTIFFQ
ncbi:MAG: hypothetical protein WCV55_02030 [Candidatus Paceibacterota bacterium]